MSGSSKFCCDAESHNFSHVTDSSDKCVIVIDESNILRLSKDELIPIDFVVQDNESLVQVIDLEEVKCLLKHEGHVLLRFNDWIDECWTRNATFHETVLLQNGFTFNDLQRALHSLRTTTGNKVEELILANSSTDNTSPNNYVSFHKITRIKQFVYQRETYQCVNNSLVRDLMMLPLWSYQHILDTEPVTSLESLFNALESENEIILPFFPQLVVDGQVQFDNEHMWPVQLDNLEEKLKLSSDEMTTTHPSNTTFLSPLSVLLDERHKNCGDKLSLHVCGESRILLIINQHDVNKFLACAKKEVDEIWNSDSTNDHDKKIFFNPLWIRQNGIRFKVCIHKAGTALLTAKDSIFQGLSTSYSAEKVIYLPNKHLSDKKDSTMETDMKSLNAGLFERNAPDEEKNIQKLSLAGETDNNLTLMTWAYDLKNMTNTAILDDNSNPLIPVNSATSPGHLTATTLSSKRKALTYIDPERLKSIIEQSRESLKCVVCKRQLQSLKTFQDHMTAHGTNGERKFFCSFNGCDKAFFTQKHLKEHEKEHEVNPTACPICKKTFKNTATANRHKRRTCEKKINK